MAIYTGYVQIAHDTYDDWRNAIGDNVNGFNYDNAYGCQCYDLAVEFWWNVGFPTGYPIITNSSAKTMWSNRMQNAFLNGNLMFELIYNATEIKRGDIIVYDSFVGNPYGHVGFADVDYDDASWTYPELPILSQNNGGTPDGQGGALANIHGYNISYFLGAFRYVGWASAPEIRKSRFPWFIYYRRFRQRRYGII